MLDTISNCLSVEDTIGAIWEAPNQKEAAKIYFFEIIQFSAMWKSRLQNHIGPCGDTRKGSIEILGRINDAIRQRWSTGGFNQVKELAWAYGERRKKVEITVRKEKEWI